MTFFEHQDAARRSTRMLVVLYLLAVAGIVIAVDLVLAGAWMFAGAQLYAPAGSRPGALALLAAVPRGVYLWGAVGTVATIAAVSLYNVWKLSEGGAAIAEMVGARHVAPDTRDPLERRLLNVVEEMAIASGVRVPAVYVMDGERGINAFAAGYDISNAVVAVTRGTLESLNRDELQGVIGHEFSHILNGDMGLNIRMLGVLEGIVFIGAVGTFLMRSVRSRDDGKSAAAIVLIGLALFIVGYVGLFFARLIKAAVARQREFLADASAVQFTRNPAGIAGALDQIQASSRGTRIDNRYAEEMSHMFFGQGVTMWLGGLFDTHPPIGERIRRVHPGFHPTRYRQGRPAPAGAAGAGIEFGAAGFAGPAAPAGVAGPAAVTAGGGRRSSDAGNAWGRSASESARLVGTMDAGNIDYAARLLARLPEDLRSAMNEAEGAGAVLVASLLAPRQEVLEEQLAALAGRGLQAIGERARVHAAQVCRLGPALHLPIIDIALPALKAAAAEQKERLVAALEAVIHADRRLSLHEFVVLTLVRTQLAPRAKPGSTQYKPLAAVRDDLLLLMSLVAHAGKKPGKDPALEREVAAAFEAGIGAIGMPGAALLPKEGFTLASAGAALENLKLAAPLAKAIIVKGLFAVVTADGTIRVIEAELMRLIGAVLDCPLPPLIEDVDPATLAA